MDRVGRADEAPSFPWENSHHVAASLIAILSSNKQVMRNIEARWGHMLMEEIRLTSWYGESTIVYMVLYISGGAGFLPSTVCCFLTQWIFDQIPNCWAAWFRIKFFTPNMHGQEECNAHETDLEKHVVRFGRPNLTPGDPWHNPNISIYKLPTNRHDMTYTSYSSLVC